MWRPRISRTASSSMVAALAVAAVVAPARAQTHDVARDGIITVTGVVRADALHPSGGPAGTPTVWREALSTGTSVTVSLERIGAPEDPSDPVWPVLTQWTITSRDSAQSFTAELYGSARDDGSMDLTGVVTSGYRHGAEVHLERRAGKAGKVVIRIAPM